MTIKTSDATGPPAPGARRSRKGPSWTKLHVRGLKSSLVASDTVYLRVIRGPDGGKVFDLSSGGCYIVGRQTGDIPLSDSKVSSRHAEIKVLGPDEYYIIDLASTNGTLLNGKRVERHKFKHDDQIQLGDSILQIAVLDGTLPVSPL
jgi:hypothetical protein